IEAQREHLQLCAICDTDQSVLRAAQSEHGVDAYDNLTEMLATSDLDLVVLCTPSGLHPAQAIEIARSKRHVMTETPMATRWGDGLRMVRECGAAGVRLFVVKQNRRNGTLQPLKEAVDQRRFGRIYMVTINVF